MKTLLLALLSIALTTMWLFNFSAGIIGGFWLFFTGGGSLIISGLIISILMPFIYSLAALPQLLLAALLTKIAEKGNRFLFSILAFITAIYGNLILSFWVIYVFNWILSYKDLPPVALWLWAYSVVMSPISYMAGKEGPDAGAGTSLGLLFTQLSFFILSIGLLFGDLHAGYGWVWLFLLIFSVITTSLGVYSIPKKENETNDYNPTIQEAQIIAGNPTTHHHTHTESQDIRYCQNCGKKVERQDNFCIHCGYKINRVED